jgi:D-proline reductase (dithiol) PrdB
MTKFAFYPIDRASTYEQYAAEYTYQQTEPTPWTPLHRRLKDCKAVIVTTAGLRLKTQHEYDLDRGRGSSDVREISINAQRADLAFDFTNYDPREAEKDLNVIVPIDRMKELVDEGSLGGLCESFFSFFGLCPNVASLQQSAQRVVEKLRRYEADIAFVFPANHVCNQTAGIIARTLEREGLSTVSLCTIREVAQQVKVPRACFINFPFGRTLGPAHATALQKSVVGDMVRALKTAERPGRIVELPYKWEGEVE